MTADMLQGNSYPDSTTIILGSENGQDVLLVILNKDLADAIHEVGVPDGNWPDRAAAIEWSYKEFAEYHLHDSWKMVDGQKVIIPKSSRTCYGTQLKDIPVKEVHQPEDCQTIELFLLCSEDECLNTGYLTEEQETLLKRAYNF